MSQSSPAGHRYLDPKTLDRIRRLDVRARWVVEGFISGQHRSPYNGFAVEFAAHREYTPGDDIRHIDWKVWSKTDRLYIKEYEQETNLQATIILDASRSMRYGETGGWSKFDYAATAAASLAYLMQRQQDAMGLVLFSNQVDKVIRPSTHPSHLKQILAELEEARPDRTTDLSPVFGQLAGQVRRRGMVVLVSDLFLDAEALRESLRNFQMRRHEVIVFHVLHEHELRFPFEENTQFRGMEIDVQVLAEPQALRRSYLEALQRYLARVKRVCAEIGADYVLLDTAQPLDAVLAGYLSFRQKLRRRAGRRQ